MTGESNGVFRAVWNGPFYIGPLTRPVSVGDVLLKALETIWRVIVSVIVLVLVIASGLFAWVQFIEPTLFPPLKSQISVTVVYDDGSTPMPPPSGKQFRCSRDFPLKITFRNESDKTISSIYFSIEGKTANRSTNILENSAWREADTIIPAGYTSQSCWRVSVPQGYDAATLNYNVEVSFASEAEEGERLAPTVTPVSRVPKPKKVTTPTKPDSPVTQPLLANLDDSDWERIGMGCSCSFTVGSPNKVKLIAGGDGLAFFRLNDKEHLCPAPDTQAMFDGPVSMSCGSTALQITPYGTIKPGFDGHSSKSRLNVVDTSGTATLSGDWVCGC